ncbi:ArsR/SmtB family transcription factor [Halorussus marinus]|uniref:ArsR/SmtB family transcription factor n=1 Tax=Halorussus marinus TaxID=2505976 RepID=UPI001FCE4132|nr:winged helix-turn-helix domain-containing protein [Halorussus marinus]
MERVNEDVREISGLLADDITQRILVETTEQPMSANELSDACDVSPQTVYRRLERLQEYELVTEAVALDDDGHHHKVYTATLDQVTIKLTADGFEFDLSLRQRMAARFRQFVTEVRDR